MLIGLLIFGVDPWLAFFDTLREPLERTFTANVGWSGLLGPVGVVIGVAIGVVVFVAGVRMGGARGYGLSILAGILAGPYTFIHYLSGIARRHRARASHAPALADAVPVAADRRSRSSRCG